MISNVNIQYRVLTYYTIHFQAHKQLIVRWIYNNIKNKSKHGMNAVTLHSPAWSRYRQAWTGKVAIWAAVGTGGIDMNTPAWQPKSIRMFWLEYTYVGGWG
jgi:hypothetical protein